MTEIMRAEREVRIRNRMMAIRAVFGSTRSTAADFADVERHMVQMWGGGRAAQREWRRRPPGLLEWAGHHSARDMCRSKDWQANLQKETHLLREIFAM